MNPIRFGGRTPRPHRHHGPINHTLVGDVMQSTYSCCGKVYDPEKARRGRLAARRGKALQKKRIEGLGGENLLGNRPNHDGHLGMFEVEHKSGPSEFPSRAWRYLKRIPIQAGQIQILIITDTPGPGHRARSVVVLDYDDWKDLHVGTPDE